jgi:hypothetical protein
MTVKGEVSYICAFPGTFRHEPNEAGARAVAEKFLCVGRPLAIYRIEVVDVLTPPVGTDEEKPA